MRHSRLGDRLVAVAAIAAALFVGAYAGASFAPTWAKEEASAVTPSPALSPDLSQETLTFAPIVQAALPAVVNVSTAKVVRSPSEGPSIFSDPFFREFFGQGWERNFRAPRERREQSLGSGVIVSPEGYVLTNNHVIEGAEEIRVSLSDERELKATLVGADPRTDIAVLKVEGENLPTIALGDSSVVEVGDIVLAIGNPFGVGQTVTMGIVGAVGRGNLGIVDYEDFIQTDASINPGNSGGALLNSRGELIGINTAIVARGAGGNQGVGFAVPIAMARDVMDQILETGSVTRGWLGVSIQEVSPALARSFGLEQARGAVVAEVVAGSPADSAGIEAGDVIVALDGEPVKDSRALRLRIAGAPPGEHVEVRVVRNGKERTFAVRLEKLPESADAPRRGDAGSDALNDLDVRELTPQAQRELGLAPGVTGVLVTAVAPGGSADEAGLRRGDVITEVGRRAVASVREFRDAVADAGDTGELLLRIHRRGASLFLVWKHR